MGSSACPWADSLLGDDLAVGPMRQKSQQAPPPLVGVAVDVLRHLVVHTGKKLVADDATGIGSESYSGCVARAGPAAMPDLIIEIVTGQLARRPKDLVLVGRADRVGAAAPNASRARSGSAPVPLVDIGQHKLQKEHWQKMFFGGSPSVTRKWGGSSWCQS